MRPRNDSRAFPGKTIERDYHSANKETVYHGGMSLRDWFAGQALAGLIASYANPMAKDPPGAADAARRAHAYADAMLAARRET